MKKNKLLLPILLSIFLAVYFFKYIHFSDITGILKRINISFLLISFILYVALSIFRSYRIKLLINGKLQLRQIVPILFSYNLLNFILPFRLGEFTYITFMKRTKEISVTEAFASLGYVRALDIIFSLSIFGLYMFLEPNVSEKIVQAKALGLILIFTSIVSLICFLYFTNLVSEFFSKLLSTDFFKKKVILAKLFEHIIEVMEVVNSYKSNKIIVLSNLLTGFVWILIFMFYYSLALAIGIPLSFFDFSFSILLINLTGLLPIQGVAGFGTFEGAVIIGLKSFGIPLESAISFGLSLHILYLLYFVSFGIFGLTVLFFKKEECNA